MRNLCGGAAISIYALTLYCAFSTMLRRKRKRERNADWGVWRRAAAGGRRQPGADNADVLDVRNGAGIAESGARRDRCHEDPVSKSAQSVVAHRGRQIDRRGVRIVRANHAS